MRLTTEQSYALLEKRGCYASQACDKCGQILGPVRFARRNDSGAWCSRDCRDGAAAHAQGTCKTCKAQLPEGKRRGAMYCDDACKQAAYRSKADARLSETPKLSVTKPSIYAGFCKVSGPGSYPHSGKAQNGIIRNAKSPQMRNSQSM